MIDIKKVGIVGIGRLGLPFALALERSGIHIVGHDCRSDYIESLKTKSFKTTEPEVEDRLKNSRIFFTTNYDDLSACETIFIFVATPSLPSGEFSNDQLISALDNLNFKNPKHIVISCTVNPGTCEYIKTRYGNKFEFSYNPAFIAQGKIIHDFENPDVVLIGSENSQNAENLSQLWKLLVKNAPQICKMNLVSAEITKVSLNCFVTMKIAFANLIGDFATKLGGDPQVILNAIGSDSRVGTKYLKYGFGYGGPCFPRDNRALSAALDRHHLSSVLFRAVDQSNKDHLDFQVSEFLSGHSKSEPIVQKGVSYNERSELLEESQQLAFALRLVDSGYRVTIEDKPNIIEELARLHHGKFELKVAAPLHKPN